MNGADRRVASTSRASSQLRESVSGDDKAKRCAPAAAAAAAAVAATWQHVEQRASTRISLLNWWKSR